MNESKPVVLFGSGPITRFVHFFLVHDSPFKVVATTVDRDFLREPEAFGLPVVPFEEMTTLYPPDEFAMFIAIGYRRVNRVREERCRQAREMGYELVSHVSPRASTWPGLEIGDNCLIMDNVIIHPFVRIGDNTIIWSGSHVGHSSVIAENCFFASHAVVSGAVTVEPNCFLGSNATIRDGLTLARDTVVGAGAVIVKDTKPGEIYAAPQPRLLPGRSDRLPSF